MAICTCGNHHGFTSATPHERAQMYNWFRQRYPSGYEAGYRQYLESYERSHGRLASDDFLPKVKETYLAKVGSQRQATEAPRHWSDED